MHADREPAPDNAPVLVDERTRRAKSPRRADHDGGQGARDATTLGLLAPIHARRMSRHAR